MLFTKNLKQKKLSKKLSDKIIKFFHIHEFIDKQTYHLNLSIIYRIYSIFHVFLIKSYNHKLNDNFISEYLVLELVDDK